MHFDFNNNTYFYSSSEYENIARLYNQSNQLIYEGKNICEFFSGIGRLCVFSKRKGELEVLEYMYEGNFVNGIYNGSGALHYTRNALSKEVFIDGRFLRDTYLNNYTGTIMTGNFHNGELEDFGKEYSKRNWYDGKTQDILVYEGHFQNGRYHGKGKKYYQSYNKANFYGMSLEHNSRDKIVNAWKYNIDQLIPNSIMYEGDFFDQSMTGQGKLFTYPNGDILYEGGFLDDKFHGKGTLYRSPSLVAYEGDWDHHRRHGFGKEYDMYGRVKEGFFLVNFFKG